MVKTREWGTEESPLNRDYRADVWLFYRWREMAEIDCGCQDDALTLDLLTEVYNHAWRQGFNEGQKPPYPQVTRETVS